MFPKTVKYQEVLSNYCRTGKQSEYLPGITPNRIQHYHRLVNNIVYSTLEQAYPITNKLLKEEEWHSLVYDFFEKHDCKTPQIWKMPYEFYLFVKDNKYYETLKRPYLNDLLYFEWMEIELHCMIDIPKPRFVKEGEIAENQMVFNPEYEILKLDYPVHITSHHTSLLEKRLYYLLIFRDYKEKAVHFINLGLFSAIFLMHLLDGEALFNTALKETSVLLKIKPNKERKQELYDMLKNMKSLGFLLGFKK